MSRSGTPLLSTSPPERRSFDGEWEAALLNNRPPQCSWRLQQRLHAALAMPYSNSQSELAQCATEELSSAIRAAQQFVQFSQASPELRST